VRGAIHGSGEAAEKVGRFAQTLRLHDGGRLEAHHTLLKLARGSRGTGFGNGFVEHARAAYAVAGVDDVSMFAGLGVGGYAWARQGLQLATTEADDAARLLDRGRQVAAMVDSARRPIHVAGRFPQLRRLTAAQFDSIAPRLVRGDVLPPDAITSVEQLAAVPDIGRRVLLGRMYPGTAQIERTGTWWQRNGAHTARQASEGVSWRTSPDVVARESASAARRVAARLPAAADPFRAEAAFLRQLGGTGSASVDDAASGARSLLRVSTSHPDASVHTTIPLRTATGRTVAIDVRMDRGRLVATERVPLRDWRNSELRRSLDAAWRELGVDQVRSGWTGIRRTVPTV
jgi:hypothetical protein